MNAFNNFVVFILFQGSRDSTVFSDLMFVDHPKLQPFLEGNMSANTGSDGDISVATEMTDSLFQEYGQCALRGYLFKKERFMTWVKLFCVIRNNFLECHKSHGDSFNPILKLFLPGSEVKEGGGDAKKKWAFQVSTVLIVCTYFDVLYNNLR